MPLAYTGGKHILPGWSLGCVGHLCLEPDLSRDKRCLYPCLPWKKKAMSSAGHGL